MDTQMEQIFAPLHDAIRAEAYTMVDILDVIGGFAIQEGLQQVAAAMAFHARDYLEENKGDVEGNMLMSEAYRRTFFDEERAAKYGTAELFNMNPEHLKSFVEFLIGGLASDKAHGGGSSNYVSTTKH